ncbi:hypothetical protein DPMN_142701, partial [Dreissena polymorpha]
MDANDGNFQGKPNERIVPIHHLISHSNEDDMYIMDVSEVDSVLDLLGEQDEDEKLGRGGILLCSCRSVGLSVGLSVCPSTRWLSDDDSRTLGPRIMKLHRYIDHDSQMTPIDFQVTSTNRQPVEVEVTMVGIVVKSSIKFIYKQSHVRYIDHDWQMTPIDFEVTRSKERGYIALLMS